MVESRGPLRQVSSKSSTFSGGLSQAHAVGGWMLVLFTAVLLAVMPLTEYFWHFDKFLRGGQDFEFGLLSLATVFCLVLITSQRRKEKVIFLLALLQRLSFPTIRAGRFIYGKLREWSAALYAMLTAGPPAETYSLPIRV